MIPSKILVTIEIEVHVVDNGNNALYDPNPPSQNKCQIILNLVFISNAGHGIENSS